MHARGFCTAFVGIVCFLPVAPLSAATAVQPVVICRDGAWCWYQDERALVVDGRMLVGSVSGAGDVQASVLDLSRLTTTTVVLHAALEVDDHAAPSFLQRSDGRVAAFYSRHGGDTLTRYRLTSAAGGDLAQWDPEQALDAGTAATYSNPFQLPAEEGKTYLFFRGLNTDPSYWSTTNGGATWAGPLKLVDYPGRPYAKYCSDGSNTIHFVFTEAHPDEYQPTSLYHMFYRAGGLYRSDGSFITNLVDAPVTPAQATRLYDGAAATGEAWSWDVHLDRAGRPVAPYATFASRSPDDHRYRYARWDGSQWRDREIARAGTRLYSGQASYSGGICVDPEQPHVVYLSSNVNITNGGVCGTGHWEIYRGQTADGGATWTWRALTRNSTVDNLRPLVPAGHTNETTVLWMRGTYTSYTSYALQIVGLFGSNVVAGADEPPPGATGAVYRLDLNEASQPVTAAGWMPLNVPADTGAGSVTVDGVTFTTLFPTFTTRGARLRGTAAAPSPDALLGDFAFADGANATLGLALGGAGSLAAGVWEADVYIWDQTSAPGTASVGYRRNGQETVVSTNVAPAAALPAFTVRFASDGVAAYDVFVRENNTANRARLNAVELRQVAQVPYSRVVVGQAPYEYYRLSRPHGENGDTLARNTVLLDQSAPTPALTAAGTPAFAGFGASNTWANFDGAANATLTDVVTGWGSDAGAISYWTRRDATGTHAGVFARRTGGAGVFDGGTAGAIGTYTRQDGSFGFGIDNVTAESPASMLELNAWHHLAFTWQRNGAGATNGVVRAYLDGVEEAGWTNKAWTSFAVAEARFGKEIGGTSRLLRGSADELAIWTRPVSQAELLEQVWRGRTAAAVVVWSEGFHGCRVADLNGQHGWAGSPWLDVRADRPIGWTRLGGEWAYVAAGAPAEDSRAARTLGRFGIGRGGTVTVEFSGRAQPGIRSLFGVGTAAGGTLAPAVYFGADGTGLCLEVVDSHGAARTVTGAFVSAELSLLRLRLEVDVAAGTAALSYYDGDAWQAPAALQGVPLFTAEGRAAADPALWDAVELRGGLAASWDNLAIVYEPAVPPAGGTLLIVR